MKILLNSRQTDQSFGSPRIFIYNLYSYFKEVDVDAYLNDWENYDNYDVVIFAKGTSITDINKAKEQNPKIKCGVVSPSDGSIIAVRNIVRAVRRRSFQSLTRHIKSREAADFFLLGSIEERDNLLQFNKNCFIFPHVERIFTKIKKHNEKPKITLSYHGNKIHLRQFSPHLKKALERLHSKYNIELVAIYNKKQLGEWRYGRPNIPVKTIQWGIDTIEENLRQSDIGLVPIVNASAKWKHILLLTVTKPFFFFQENEKSYLLQFKMCANAGRAFVYHQLGIPVVAGFVPSMSHIIGSNQNGFLANSEDGWYYSIEELIKSTELRKKMSEQAKSEFDINYNPLIWAEDLAKKLTDLTNVQSDNDE